MGESPRPLPEHSLAILQRELERVDATVHEYVLFGSVVLYLHGIRETIGDIDLFVNWRVWQRWGEADWYFRAPHAHDPPFLEYTYAHPPLVAFYDWSSRDPWMDVGRCFELAEGRSGFQCLPLVEVRRHKALAYEHARDLPTHQKHLADLALIDERLGA